MPLEDVHFMKNNSDIDSKMIFVDSSKRKKQFYPFPSKYVVEFNEPFHNICGIEILDAMLPSTMFNIEKFNNVFTYSKIHVKHPYIADENVNANVNVNVNNDDENLMHYLTELSNNSIFLKNFRDFTQSNRIFITEFSSLSIMRTLQEEYGYNVRLADRVLVMNRVELVINTENKTNEQIVKTSHGSFSISSPDVIPNLENEEVTMIGGGENDPYTGIVFFQYFYSTSKEYDKIYNTIEQLESTSLKYVIHNCMFFLEVGNYDVVSLITEFNKQLFFENDFSEWSYESDNNYDKSFPYQLGELRIIPANDSVDIVKNMTIEFKMDAIDYRIMINTSKCSMSDVMGLSISDMSGVGYKNGYKKFYIGDDLYFYSLVNGNKTYISSPGIINLNSNVRYTLLRCLEIESHIHNSFIVSGYCPGIGLFKHTGNNDQNNYRFDFTNFHKIPFHPIGKLSKLTLSFELPNGGLYDFKGCDHILLIALKYYRPREIKMQDSVTIENN